MAKVNAKVAKPRPFRNRIRALLKRTPSTLPDKRCMNLQEFVERLHCDYSDFSKKINGHIAMTKEEVEAVVEEFAKLETIQTRSEVRELFALKDIYDIRPGYWNKSAFENLKNDDLPEQNKPKAEPTLTTEHVNEKPSQPIEQPAPPTEPVSKSLNRKKLMQLILWILVVLALLAIVIVGIIMLVRFLPAAMGA